MASKRPPSQSSSGYDDSKVSGIDVKPLKSKPIKVKAIRVMNENVQWVKNFFID